MPFPTLAIPFDVYRELPSPAHRWLLQCLARYADRAGRCFPPLRRLADDARMSLATVSRRLAEMARMGCFTRERKPGGVYRYELAQSYRPRWPGKDRAAVPAAKLGVSQAETQQAKPTKQIRKERFGDSPDDRRIWEPRLRSWTRSGGRFWNPFWGPKPTEAGCFAPPALLTSSG